MLFMLSFGNQVQHHCQQHTNVIKSATDNCVRFSRSFYLEIFRINFELVGMYINSVKTCLYPRMHMDLTLFPNHAVPTNQCPGLHNDSRERPPVAPTAKREHSRATGKCGNGGKQSSSPPVEMFYPQLNDCSGYTDVWVKLGDEQEWERIRTTLPRLRRKSKRNGYRIRTYFFWALDFPFVPCFVYVESVAHRPSISSWGNERGGWHVGERKSRKNSLKLTVSHATTWWFRVKTRVISERQTQFGRTFMLLRKENH